MLRLYPRSHNPFPDEDNGWAPSLSSPKCTFSTVGWPYLRSFIFGTLRASRPMHFYSLLQLSVAGGSLLLAPAARAQTVPPPTFFTTYTYTAYTVFDTTSPDEPTQVSGVGGTLTLRPDGTYEKHLSIVAPSKPYYFDQQGTYATAGDSIRFSFFDQKGPETLRGTFQLDSISRHLTITILGYPAGNQGVYELEAAHRRAGAPPWRRNEALPPRSMCGKKRRP